jgi:hypothetical protein
MGAPRTFADQPHDDVTLTFDAAGNVIETHEHNDRTMREPGSKFS